MELLLAFCVLVMAVAAVTPVRSRMEIVHMEHYMSRNGDCPGRTILQMVKTDLDECASECDRLPNCRAFLYVPEWSGLDDSPYCDLKYATCNALTHGAARHYHFYDKFVNFHHYTRRYGRCMKHTIKVMRNTGLMLCQAECDRLPHCTSFTFSVGRHDIRRLPQCELKYKSCARPVFASSREIQTYDKIENFTNPIPEPTGKVMPSTPASLVDNSTDVIIDARCNMTSNCTTMAPDANVTEAILTPDPPSALPNITDAPTTAPPIRHYQYYHRPGDCPGSNINQQPIVTDQPGLCRHMCDDTPECTAFHLILPKDDGDNMTKCYLKWDTCDVTSAYSIEWLEFYDKIEVEPGFVMRFGKCSDAPTSDQVHQVDAARECRDKCDEWKPCVGFDYRVGHAWAQGKKSTCHLRKTVCKIHVTNRRANYDRSYQRITNTGRVVSSQTDDVTAFIVTGVALTLVALALAAVYVVRVRRKLVNPHTRFDQATVAMNQTL